MLRVMGNYNTVYVFVKGWITYNHSLFDLFKVAAIVACAIMGREVPDAAFFTACAKPYFIFTALLATATTLYLARKETALWKQLTLCIIMMDLLPYASADYKLLNLFIPFCFFLKAKPGRNDFAYALLFGLLMIPKNYVITHTLMLGIVANPLLLIALAGLIIREGLEQQPSAGNAIAFAKC